MGRSWYSVYRKNGKVGYRGIPVIFISYAKNHTRNCYHVYNPNARYMTEMRDIRWLHHMHYGKSEARGEVIVYPQVALPFKPEDAEARDCVMLNASELKVKSKDDMREFSTVHMRLGRVVSPWYCT